MPQSIFDWDDEVIEEKPEQPKEPVAMIPYQPVPVEPQPEPSEYRSDPFRYQAEPDPQPEQKDPVPFEYHSDPFQTQPIESSTGQYGFEQQPEHVGHTTDPFGDDYDPFAVDTPNLEPTPLEYQPSTPEETSRRSGLAFSAGIVFFSSVVFMLFLGWIADWLIGSSPWGLVGGIVLGSVIGLIQFVRITSQIFNSKKSEAAMRPLMPPDDDQ